VSRQLCYLLDTNLLSETRKPRPDPGVLSFLRQLDPEAAFISVLTMGELRKGVAARRRKESAPEATTRLAVWVDGLEASYAHRILGIDIAIASLWGDWSSDRPRPVVDTLLAATAMVNNLTLVTRNLRDLSGLPVQLHNPWTT
jgi:predicted nucleic acid-binding protein